MSSDLSEPILWNLTPKSFKISSEIELLSPTTYTCSLFFKIAFETSSILLFFTGITTPPLSNESKPAKLKLILSSILTT